MRFGIISDIHGNLLALESVLAELDAAGIDRLICLGDVVGYGPDPIECLDLVFDRDAVMVIGNHEEAMLRPEIAKSFRDVAREAIEWTSRRIQTLRPDLIDRIERLPGMVYLESDLMLVHDSPIPGGRRYLINEAAAGPAFRGVDTSVCLVGHTHLPGCFRRRNGDHDSMVESRPGAPGVSVRLDSDARYILNPGSVGQPRDGDPRAAYAILDLEAREISWRRAGYDIPAAQSRALASGLPARAAERLALGA
ncbi:MAG: metallophosphoesterase family protein [Phycisphaerales bacterium]|nr:metallophosphoesterase family protein [Phycisphaerales bacterium]MDG1979310.1 metallophosphoesterase family protein [Phycisphaerales bacterium]MDG2133143.1 metallophosphoesterase family protein [Phycisphaerales bacterium]